MFKKEKVKGNLSVLSHRPNKKKLINKYKKTFNTVSSHRIIVVLFIIAIGSVVYFASAATDPYAADYVPVVTKQQLIDDITMYHDGGHFPFTPPSWNNIQAPTFTELNTPGHKTPGSVALNGRTAGIYEWVELSTRENSPTNLNAVVEFREVGMATYRSGSWEKIMEFKHNQLDGPLKAIVNDVSVNGVFHQNEPGYNIGNNWSPNGNNRMVGFGLGSAAHKVGEPWPSNIPGWPEERLKAHASIAGNSYGAGVDYCNRINCAGATIQAVQGWVTARVISREGKSYQDLINAGDTAGAQQLKDAYYVLMPGWDQFTDQQVYDGTMGRARRVLPEWQTFTTTSMSQAQINGGLPAPPIPGYDANGTGVTNPSVSVSASSSSGVAPATITVTATSSLAATISITQSGSSTVLKSCTNATTCTYSSNYPSAGTYTFNATATTSAGGSGSGSGSVTLTGPVTPLGNGTYNDDNAAVSYSGSWTADNSNTDNYNGDEHYSNTPNDTATIQFNGEQLQLISHKNTDMGQVTVTIDGVAQGTVGEWYASSYQTNTINWTSSKLSKANHTAVIKINTTKNAASAGYYVSIDKIVVSNAAATAASTSLEAEGGTLSPGLSPFSDVNASNGGYIRFKKL